MIFSSPGTRQDTSPVSIKIHTGDNCELSVTSRVIVSLQMTDCVDGAERLGGPDLGSGHPAPGLRMEDMALAEKLDRTLLSNTG